MFQLENIIYLNDGKTISYDYQVGHAISKYFTKNNPFYLRYSQDVSEVPKSIAAVPLLANVMPIAWFAGFDVYVDELDTTFYRSLLELKKEFAIHFPQIKPDTTLHVKNLVTNTISSENSALLFSGGLDAFESLTRNLDKNPFLVSVRGADIDVSDKKRWADFLRFNAQETIINKDRLCYVESNLQTFYTYEVDLLVGIGWWGKIQHGMALISLIAPLSVVNKIGTVMIASSNTGEVSFGWGSTSETDEKVQWANMTVIHDGFHLRRTEKIENIVDFAKKTGEHVKLRVCYSELRISYNCSRCAKCQRTMLGLILCGENPDGYGFEVKGDFYSLVFSNFEGTVHMTTGVAYEWRCLQEKAAVTQNPFVIQDAVGEKNNIGTFAALKLDAIVNKDVAETSTLRQLKFTLINKYPGLFKLYMKARRKF